MTARRLAAMFGVMLCAATAALGQTQQDLVYRLESFLAELGYAVGAVDGLVDAATYEAIRRYQGDRGLAVTGGLDMAGYQALEQEIVERRAAAATQPAPAPVAPVAPVAPAPALSQAAAGASTRVGEVLFHELPDCAGERGLMLYSYRRVMTDLPFYQISEICWLEEAAILQGLEPQGNLTLVEAQGGYTVYEDLSHGSEGYQRTKVSVDRTGNVEAEEGHKDLSVYISHNPRTGQSAPSNGAQDYRGTGFLYTGTFAPQAAGQPFEVMVDIRLGSGTKDMCNSGAPAYSTGEPGNVTLVGRIDLGAPQTVTLRALEQTSGRAEGTLDLSFAPDGAIRGAASVYFENPRIAGLGPCEWVRAEASLDVIIGTTTGSRGVEFRSIGVGKGRFTDVNGATYPLIATGTVDGYPEEY